MFCGWYDVRVDAYAEGYGVIGEGMEIAMGALWVVNEYIDNESAVVRVRFALDACEHHSPWVRRPFVIMKVEEPKDA